jgi:hypothetical protein
MTTGGVIMKKGNLKKLAICLTLLFSPMLVGCAQTNTASDMNNSMDTMGKSESMMNKTDMKEPMDTMKSEPTEGNMGRTEDKMMQSDKPDMMK